MELNAGIAFASGLVLKHTNLTEGYVLALAALVGLATAVGLSRRVSQAALKKGFFVLTAVMLVAVPILAVSHFQFYRILAKEDHLIEWLSALALLAAALVAVVVVARAGRGTPRATFLAAGCFFAFWRELEWGRCFFGCKLWYSRNLFRLRSYTDSSYFDRFTHELRIPARPLYFCHLIISPLVIVLSAAMAVYLLRHRREFIGELPPPPRGNPGPLPPLRWASAAALYPLRVARAKLAELWRSAPGRYLMLGVGGYVFARLAGSAFKYVLRSDALNKWRSARGLAHGALEEPIELWAAIAVLLAAIILHKALDKPAGARPEDEHT